MRVSFAPHEFSLMSSGAGPAVLCTPRDLALCAAPAGYCHPEFDHITGRRLEMSH